MMPVNNENQLAGCDHQRIREFLDSQQYHLDDPELIQHLDQCDSCREFLVSEAGSEKDWHDVTQLLQPCEFDEAGNAAFSTATLSGVFVDQPTSVREVLESLVPAEDPHHLGRLGPYLITGVIGVGGMGVVLKAIDPTLDRIVAVKVLSPRLATNETARKRFAREAKAAAAVLHPNVISIHSVSSESRLPYLVMACIRGGSLKKRLEKEGPLSIVETLRIATQISSGLNAAHEQGLIHRDIKPENILLEEGVERVTITDFGLARSVDDNTVTQLGSIAGTPQYMSPEQARGEQLDQQSDLFSLGCVLYEMCTGTPPFRDATSYGVMRKIIDDSPTPMNQINKEIPTWMMTIVNRLMAKRREERWNSAEEVHAMLEQCLSHVQQPNAHSLPKSLLAMEKPRGTVRRKLLIASGLAIAICWFSIYSHLLSRPYSATDFATLEDSLGNIVTELPDEQLTLTSGRVTIGDQQRILGSWQIVEMPLGPSGGRADISRGASVFSFSEDQTYSRSSFNGLVPSAGKWKLDDTTVPRRITLELDGVERKAIYKLQGKFLSLCYQEGVNDFPESFPSHRFQKNGTVLLVMRSFSAAEYEVSFSDPSPSEVALLCADGAITSFPNLAELKPDVAAELAKGEGNLYLPAVKSLPPEVATALAGKQTGWLSLLGLRTLSPAVAKELAKANAPLVLGLDALDLETAILLARHPGSLSLPRVRTLTPEVAEVLASNHWLSLNGLDSLDVEVATALAKHRGWLSLDGVESLSTETAAALSPFTGSHLDLNGLQTIDTETAKAIVNVKSFGLTMNALETISPEVAEVLCGRDFSQS